MDMTRIPHKLLFTLVFLLSSSLVVAAADETGLLFKASFDAGLQADFAGGESHPLVEMGACSNVSRVGGRALAATPGSYVSYETNGNFVVQEGTVEIVFRPFVRYDDNANHVLFSVGPQGTPNSVNLWKTGVYNDLRLRIVTKDRKNFDVAYTGAKDWKPGEWHHVAATWDAKAGLVALYVDGRHIGTRKGSMDISSPPYQMFIGNGPVGQSSAHAEIDEVKVYDRVKSPQEIAASCRSYHLEQRESRLPPLSEQPDSMSMDLVEKPHFFFVVISDTHVAEPGREGRYAHNWRVEKMIDQVNLLKPAFVINCGDIITSHPCREEYEGQCRNALEMFSRLSMPIHYVAGNHDVGNKHSMTFAARQLRHGSIYVSEEFLKTYRDYFGRDFYSFDYHGCHFVILNDQLFNTGLPSEKRQWTWLLDDLEKSRGSRFQFMFMHVPIFWVSPEDMGPNNYEVIDAPRRFDLLDLIKKYQFRVVFTGHTHHRISNWYQGTEFLTVPSTTFERPFGYHYGVPAEAVIYDPHKVGYFVVRVEEDDVHVNLVRTYEPGPGPGRIQQDASPPSRIINRKSEEITESLFGLKSAPVPPIERGPWDIDNLVDGRIADPKRPQNDASTGWVSAELEDEKEGEWIQVDMSVPREINRVELAPRPGGRGFPRDFEIQTSMDGKTWHTVVKKKDLPPPPGPAAVRFEFPAQEARSVRLYIPRVPRMGQVYRVSLMEFGVHLDDSPNFASRLLGSRIRAKSGGQSGKKVVVDDQAWFAPTYVGAKWVRMPSDLTSWAAVERQKGELAVSHSLERALAIGRPRGIAIVMPLTTRNILYPPEARVAAFGNYCCFMAKWFSRSVRGWEISARGGVEPELLAEATAQILSLDPNGSIAVGKLPLTEPDELSRFLIRCARKDVSFHAVILSAMIRDKPENEFATLLDQAVETVQKADKNLEIWMDATLPQEEADATVAAKTVARAYLIAQDKGARFFLWCDVGERGAILDGIFNPTYSYYVVRVLNTLYGSELHRTDLPRIDFSTKPIGLRCHAVRDAQGCLLVAVWSSAAPAADSPGSLLDMSVDGTYDEIKGADVLSCTVSNIRFEGKGHRTFIPGLLVRDHPIILKLKKKR